jgi:hypothetical protein
MQLISGDLINETITTDQPNFDLKGMVCPTFQNLGDSDVMFNGLILKKGVSYSVNVPTIVLQNKTDIRFLSETGRMLVISYVRPLL